MSRSENELFILYALVKFNIGIYKFGEIWYFSQTHLAE